MTKHWGVGTIAIPAPFEVDAVMRKVPKSKLFTINQIRQFVAQKHSATIVYPMTLGIFAYVAVSAVDEDEATGEPEITSDWRTLKGAGMFNPKYLGGAERQKMLLE